HEALTQVEAEGLLAVVAGVEFLALLAVLAQPAGVMHRELVALLRRAALADLHVAVLQPRARRHHAAPRLGVIVRTPGTRGAGGQDGRDHRTQQRGTRRHEGLLLSGSRPHPPDTTTERAIDYLIPAGSAESERRS